MNKTPAIIFDLGGVLIDWNPYYLYRKMFEDDEAIQKFIDETRLLKWNEKQDEGRPFAEAVKILSAQNPHYEKQIRAFHERWIEMVGGPIHPTVEILSELRNQQHELYALTNWSAETYPMARARFEFLSWFRKVVVSGEVKMIKPDPRIYALVLEEVKRPAQECIFIDDSRPNIEAAHQLGFQTIHFQGADHLRAELAKHKLFATE